MVSTTLFAALALAQAPASPAPAQTLFRVAQSNERKISLRVNDASLKDVLSKLPKVDYVVDADAFKARRITLNLTDVTTSEALNAIAAAIDAHWETVSGVRVLKKGAGFGFDGTTFRTFTVPPTKKFEFFGDKDGKTPFRALPLGVFKNFSFDGKAMPGLTPEQMKEVQKALEEARESMKSMPDVSVEVQKALENARKEMRTRSFDGDESRTEYEKARADIEARRKAIEQGRRTLGDNVGRSDLKVDALLKSLTPMQKELAKSRGFLKLSDLSPEQRKMTGYEGTDTFEIKITRDGETLNIKNG